MWSDAYRDYVKVMVESAHDEYPYYMAHTCTYFGSGSSYNQPSFKIYLSKEPIVANGLYTYVLPADTLVYSVIGGNASSNYRAERVNVTTVGGIVSVDDYEFVYTNAEFETASIQPDILATSALSDSTFVAVGLILIVVLLATAVGRIIRG